MGREFGIVAIIFGMISIPLSVVMAATGSLTHFYNLLLGTPDISALFSIIGWLIPAIAIIFGIMGIIKDDYKGLAIAGLTLGILALIFGLLIYFMFATWFSILKS